MSDWRKDFNVDSPLRDRAEQRISERLGQGRLTGAIEYGPDFEGDPLIQAFEEAVDLALYLAVEIEARKEPPR